MAQPSDTSPEVERIILEGYRRMTVAEKLSRVVALNRTLDTLATARIVARYGPDIGERELRLRLASLRLEAKVMTTVFGWGPGQRGL